jgi:hypothetical protein
MRKIIIYLTSIYGFFIAITTITVLIFGLDNYYLSTTQNSENNTYHIAIIIKDRLPIKKNLKCLPEVNFLIPSKTYKLRL